MTDIDNLDRFVAAIDDAAHDPAARHATGQPPLASTLKEIRFRAKEHYWQFTPSYGSNFEHRLVAWINNPGLSREDKVALLRLVPELAFVDRDDMLSLYRTAFSDQIKRWLMDQASLDFRLPTRRLKQGLLRAVRRTWFCGLTDSMDIGQFCHVNHISNRAQRPQWQTLSKFGSPSKISKYIHTEKIQRLVIVEDFVGSGQQSHDILSVGLRDLVPDIPVLFVPLILSEDGVTQLRSLADTYPNFKTRAALVLPTAVHVRKDPHCREPHFVRDARRVIEKTATYVGTRQYGFHDVGALLVLHSNCPNNVPPLVWRERETWKPIFPRVSRAGG